MEARGYIHKYLHKNGRLMQIATVGGDQPWICTVYYVVDGALNLYWLSLPNRRHSQEIAHHQKVAAAIVMKQDQPVVGVQVEGDAEEVTSGTIIARVMEKYAAKYDMGKEFYANFLEGKNQHKLYRIKPRMFVLFDELDFPEEGRIEWWP